MLRRQVAQQVKEHADAGRGTSPMLSEWAVSILEPRQDWRRVLDSHVRAATGRAAGRRDYTYTRPSRRQAPRGAGGRALLAGMYAPEPPRVTVIRDTSGSMTMDRDLVSEAAAEIDGMLHARARVTLIDTDTHAHRARALNRTAGAGAAQGGGGTDMGCGAAGRRASSARARIWWSCSPTVTRPGRTATRSAAYRCWSRYSAPTPPAMRRTCPTGRPACWLRSRAADALA